MKLTFQSGEKPLWSQLYDILEIRILNGDYKEGENLPSEMVLMEEFGVSRITVRQAMDKLMNAKLIDRKRGKGTVVLKRENNVTTSFQSSFYGLEERNHINDRRIISLEYVKPPIDVAYYFNIPVSKKVLKLVRQTYIDDKPITHYETYFNPVVLLDVNSDFHISMYDTLEQVGFPITHVKEKITATLMTPQDQVIFKNTNQSAIMNRIRMGSSNNIPVEYTVSKYVASGYELTIDLK